MGKKNKFKKLKKLKKQSKDYSWAFAAFIMLLMIGSIFGFISYYGMENSNSIEDYNGFKIINQDNRWIVNLDEKTLDFYNHPQQLEHIGVEPAIVNELLDNNPVFVTFDPNENMLSFIDQIRLDLSLSINAIGGIANESLEYPNLEKITCNDTIGVFTQGNVTQQYERNIIYLKYGDNNSINLDKGCVIIEANNAQDFAELKDRLVYTLFGIMN